MVRYEIMLVLGIESSCDETAAAVVADGRQILSNVVASQVKIHERFGGVVPELASREHLRKIVPIVDEACRQAGTTLNDIEGIAVTEGPGLIGSLLVGLVYGKALALSLRKPLVGVNHLEGHIHAVLLQNYVDRQQGKPVPEAGFPNITLVVSGGHTILYRVDSDLPAGINHPSFSYKMLGQTRDDAAGEAFDKVAKLLALGYPGGPVIDKLARYGNPAAVEFGRIRMKGNPLDFSFSGLKTAVLYRVRGTPLASEAEERRVWREASDEKPTVDQLRGHCSQTTLDLIAAFQETVVNDLIERTVAAAEAARIQTVFVSGGVACNSLLRERFAKAGAERGFNVFFPSLLLSTDNAAMIAAAGYYKLASGQRDDASLNAHASFPLGTSIA
ncbi:MAG TPA: tRNA (adenosine(37)-N6)-threonylcarbamoyltransferase complex transferase subunit TsaD [Terriglobia bacterium]|nr:tRNA (adenosine(37)-N6)-threonylcarbamoyltransferase complex transferase subunit TsaD [Terriglobia bacterium]